MIQTINNFLILAPFEAFKNKNVETSGMQLVIDLDISPL